MRTIPQIRVRLIQLSEELRCPELAQLAEETRRRPPVRRARVKRPALTPELRDEIRRYAAAFPDASYLEISQALDCNSGRISEALAGFRE